MLISRKKLNEAAEVAGKIALELIFIIMLRRFKGGRLWK
jgi:hypothetical protein